MDWVMLPVIKHLFHCYIKGLKENHSSPLFYEMLVNLTCLSCLVLKYRQGLIETDFVMCTSVDVKIHTPEQRGNSQSYCQGQKHSN